MTIIYANSDTDIFVYLCHSFVILTTCTCNESYEIFLYFFVVYTILLQ